MRQQAAIHIDETSWRVDGVPHWLWVFVNDVVALYVVSRSRGSKVPQALLGPSFDGVVEATNNAAERALRGAVVRRKTSFGSRSKRGAQAFARMLSIIMTWERQGKDFFTTAQQALTDTSSQS
jgi:transposase-like protein